MSKICSAFNAGHIFDVDATDPVSMSKGLMEGRRLARELHNAFREYAPSLSCSFLAQTSPVLGLRESRRIIGDYTFTIEDYLERRSFPDEIFRGVLGFDIVDADSPAFLCQLNGKVG